MDAVRCGSENVHGFASRAFSAPHSSPACCKPSCLTSRRVWASLVLWLGPLRRAPPFPLLLEGADVGPSFSGCATSGNKSELNQAEVLVSNTITAPGPVGGAGISIDFNPRSAQLECSV